MRSCRRPSREVSSSSCPAASASRCGNTLISARDSRAPSMIDAWLSSSETITSSRVRIAATVPAFAANPEGNISASSAPLNAAKRRSSSRCNDMVPAIERTAPDPAPNSRAAWAAASFIRASPHRPR